MNFFTQEAVVCPHCHAVYTLGLFTRQDLGQFSQQIQLRECTEEAAMLARVQALFARYPKLQALHAKGSSMWMSHGLKPVEEWLHTEIPESSQWNFTVEEREVLEYLDHHFFGMPGYATKVQEDCRSLLQKVTANTVRCPQCEQGALQLEEERLASGYTSWLRELSYHNGEEAGFSAGCWLVTAVVGLLSVLGLKSGVGGVKEICALLGVVVAACVWMLYMDWATARKLHASIKTTDQQAEFGTEEVFRGRYYSHCEFPYFVWHIGAGKTERHCELMCIREDGWDWLKNVIEEYEPFSNVSAVFDLEFRGVFIGEGRFGHRGLNRYLVEIEEMLSAQLVSVHGGSAASKELLRPAAGGSETPVEQFVRPAEQQD